MFEPQQKGSQSYSDYSNDRESMLVN